MLSANGISLEQVNYTRAVQVMTESGEVLRLYVKRRVVLPPLPEPQTFKVSLAKAKKKDGECSVTLTAEGSDGELKTDRGHRCCLTWDWAGRLHVL